MSLTMKREVLFRGASEYDGKMEYGFLSWADTPRGRAYFINNKIVKPESVSQYTGIIDKNGTKIFEGDTLKFVTFGFNPEVFITSIVWSKGGYALANGRSLFYFGQQDYSKLDDAVVCSEPYQVHCQ